MSVVDVYRLLDGLARSRELGLEHITVVEDDLGALVRRGVHAEGNTSGSVVLRLTVSFPLNDVPQAVPVRLADPDRPEHLLQIQGDDMSSHSEKKKKFHEVWDQRGTGVQNIVQRMLSRATLGGRIVHNPNRSRLTIGFINTMSRYIIYGVIDTVYLVLRHLLAETGLDLLLEDRVDRFLSSVLQVCLLISPA